MAGPSNDGPLAPDADVATRTRPVVRGPGQTADIDRLVVEEPLEIRVEERSIAITMRTPGADRELAAGFLLSEGILDGPDDLTSLAHLPGDAAGNTIIARVAGGVEAHHQAIERASRELYASSACGVCGTVSLDRVELVARFPVAPVRLVPEVLSTLPEVLRAGQEIFAATGGLHGAALVGPDGVVELVREDVGRHNAVDKVLGWRLLTDALPVHDRLLVVSGRVGFEIVHKARVAGVGAIVAMGAASTLSVELAERAGMALVGFLRADRWTRYC